MAPAGCWDSRAVTPVSYMWQHGADARNSVELEAGIVGPGNCPGGVFRVGLTEGNEAGTVGAWISGAAVLSAQGKGGLKDNSVWQGPSWTGGSVLGSTESCAAALAQLLPGLGRMKTPAGDALDTAGLRPPGYSPLERRSDAVLTGRPTQLSACFMLLSLLSLSLYTSQSHLQPPEARGEPRKEPTALASSGAQGPGQGGAPRAQAADRAPARVPTQGQREWTRP